MAHLGRPLRSLWIQTVEEAFVPKKAPAAADGHGPVAVGLDFGAHLEAVVLLQA